MDSGETPLREPVGTPRESPALEAGLVVSAGAAPLTERELAARRWAIRIAISAVIWVYLASVVWHTEQAPAYALVARDPSAKVYLSPKCALGRSELPISTVEAAKKDAFRPDSACNKNGGFLGASQTVMQEVLSYVYLHPKRGTRWRPDGSWKW